MSSVIADATRIRDLHREFVSRLDRTGFAAKMRFRVGYRGGSQRYQGRYSESTKLWWVNSTSDGNRYWNPFGVGHPFPGRNVSNSIVVEINFPFSGIDRRIAGAFIESGDGEIWIGHRGKIGGGRRGIGKSLLLNAYKGPELTADDGSQPSAFIPISKLKSESLCADVAKFVQMVDRAKSGASPPSVGTRARGPSWPAETGHTFRPEFEGILDYSASSNHHQATRMHGLIVNQLARSLELAGFKVANSKHFDLLVSTRSEPPHSALVEVKTDLSTTSIYTAIGQLYAYHEALTGSVELVSLFPRGLPDSWRNLLQSLEIHHVEFRPLTKSRLQDAEHLIEKFKGLLLG